MSSGINGEVAVVETPVVAAEGVGQPVGLAMLFGQPVRVAPAAAPAKEDSERASNDVIVVEAHSKVRVSGPFPAAAAKKVDFLGGLKKRADAAQAEVAAAEAARLPGIGKKAMMTIIGLICALTKDGVDKALKMIGKPDDVDFDIGLTRRGIDAHLKTRGWESRDRKDPHTGVSKPFHPVDTVQQWVYLLQLNLHRAEELFAAASSEDTGRILQAVGWDSRCSMTVVNDAVKGAALLFMVAGLDPTSAELKPNGWNEAIDSLKASCCAFALHEKACGEKAQKPSTTKLTPK